MKDPLRWLRAEIEAKTLKMKQVAEYYHQLKSALANAEIKMHESAKALGANGHPLYAAQPETPPAAEASPASEVASNEATE